MALLAPVINATNFCKKKCDYQRVLSGTATFDGEIFIVDETDPTIIVATGIASGGTWTVSSSALRNNKKYIAQGIRHDGLTGGTVTINASAICEAECVLVGELTGTTNEITTGIISAYLSPYVDGEIPVANGVITNNNFSIKSPLLTEGASYVFYALNVEIV
jgi:hypothetical protein